MPHVTAPPDLPPEAPPSAVAIAAPIADPPISAAGEAEAASPEISFAPQAPTLSELPQTETTAAALLAPIPPLVGAQGVAPSPNHETPHLPATNVAIEPNPPAPQFSNHDSSGEEIPPEAAQDTAPGASPCAPTRQGCIERVQVQGSSVFSPSELDTVLQPFTGRSLSPEEQAAAADALTQLYLNEGYITSRAILADPAVQDGVLHIQVIEGGLERIDILGVERLHPDYVRSRIELAAQQPINSAQLEEQLRLMRESPLFDNIEASLGAGETVGSSILTVRVDEADPWDGFVGVNNHSSSLVGTEQFTASVAHQNLTGHGDRLGASLRRTFSGGATHFELGYTLPINPMEGSLHLGASFEGSRIPVSPTLNIDGNAQEYTVRFRQPLVRTLAEEFALSLSFDYRSGQTFLGNIPFGFGFGPDPATGISRTSVLRFGQDYVSRDVQGAWALRSQFSLGLPILGATANPAPIPDGQFFSWLGQAQRVQRLNDDHLLIVQADVQLSPSALLPSEQFALGGASSVQGYRQNIRAGDSGIRLSIEDRITLQRNEAGLSTLQLAPFAEIGTVWNAGGNPNPLPAQNFLAGVGLGLLWEPLPHLNLRLDAALPLVTLPSRGNVLQQQGIYFQLGYRI